MVWREKKKWFGLNIYPHTDKKLTGTCLLLYLENKQTNKKTRKTIQQSKHTTTETSTTMKTQNALFSSQVAFYTHLTLIKQFIIIPRTLNIHHNSHHSKIHLDTKQAIGHTIP